MAPLFIMSKKASTAFLANKVSRPSGDEDRRFAARKEIRRPEGRRIFHTPLREKYFRAGKARPKMDFKLFRRKTAKLKRGFFDSP